MRAPAQSRIIPISARPPILKADSTNILTTCSGDGATKLQRKTQYAILLSIFQLDGTFAAAGVFFDRNDRGPGRGSYSCLGPGDGHDQVPGSNGDGKRNRPTQEPC